MSAVNSDTILWKESPFSWALLAITAILLIVLYQDAFMHLFSKWNNSEEYSYGFIVPLVSLFLIWQKKDILQKVPFEGSWLGVAITLIGLSIFVIGQLSTLYVVMEYSLIVVLAGIVLSVVGRNGFKHFWVPLLVLIFMIPLPNIITRMLSTELQLISSQIGVWVIELFGISVLLEGNVIDLGSYKLQVVEACSGLRYLFPLMTFGFITAYFYKVEFWKRAVIFLSTIPITVLMNSFRIGVIGITVEYWGQEMAEGFLHDFEGWVVFMACTGVLFLEMWLLTKVGKNKTTLKESFAIELPAKTPKGMPFQARPLPRMYIAVTSILAFVTITALMLPEREEIHPARKEFAKFPLAINTWSGKEERLEKIYVDALKFEDYILTDFKNLDNASVNFYVAYYASQKSGESAHSPRSCIPGGGWKIEDIRSHHVEGVSINNNPLMVNRTLISMGDHKQLVYYWFQQRGRIITNEYLVKWYLLWDALTKNRTDGALVRLTAYVKPGQDVSQVDALLSSFISDVNPYFDAYIPN